MMQIPVEGIKYISEREDKHIRMKIIHHQREEVVWIFYNTPEWKGRRESIMKKVKLKKNPPTSKKVLYHKKNVQAQKKSAERP